MKIKNALIAAVFSAIICAGSTNALAATYVKEAPPPIIKETFEQKPGHIWQHGYYTWSAKEKKFNWNPGKHAQMRKGKIWLPNRWHRDKNGWKFIKSTWVSREKFEADRKKAQEARKCGVKKGYKIGYRKSAYADEYNFKNKN